MEKDLTAIGTGCEMIVARIEVNKVTQGSLDVVFTHHIHSPFIQAERVGVILAPMGTKLHCPVQEINILLSVQFIFV